MTVAVQSVDMAPNTPEPTALPNDGTVQNLDFLLKKSRPHNVYCRLCHMTQFKYDLIKA